MPFYDIHQNLLQVMVFDIKTVLIHYSNTLACHMLRKIVPEYSFWKINMQWRIGSRLFIGFVRLYDMSCFFLNQNEMLVQDANDFIFSETVSHSHFFLVFKACKKWNSCFLRFFTLAKNEIHVFWGFWNLQKMKSMFSEIF